MEKDTKKPASAEEVFLELIDRLDVREFIDSTDPTVTLKYLHSVLAEQPYLKAELIEQGSGRVSLRMWRTENEHLDDAPQLMVSGTQRKLRIFVVGADGFRNNTVHTSKEFDRYSLALDIAPMKRYLLSCCQSLVKYYFQNPYETSNPFPKYLEGTET